MIDITVWMDGFMKSIHENFENRVWFVGLQGSYARGEATETSDIDVVVILDALSSEDIQAYRNMLDTLPHRATQSQSAEWKTSTLLAFTRATVWLLLPSSPSASTIKRCSTIALSSLSRS